MPQDALLPDDAEQPYRVTHNRYGAFRWQWTCQTQVTTGPLTRTCPEWGLGRSEAEADDKARRHVATAHPTTTEEPTR